MSMEIRRPAAHSTLITLTNGTTPWRLTAAAEYNYTPHARTVRLDLCVCTGSTLYWAESETAPASIADMIPVAAGQILNLNWVANEHDYLWIAGATASDKIRALPEGRS